MRIPVQPSRLNILRKQMSGMRQSSAYKSDTAHSPQQGVSTEDVPTRISNTTAELLKVYSTKNQEEQAGIIERLYSEEAHFVDPLMDVKTPREINLAFLSLIKLFKDVKVQQKNVYLNPSPQLPSHLQATNTQQYVVNNQQTYLLERKNAFARCLLPDVVDLDVNTYLTFSQESGRIVYHEDKWLNKGFRFPGFLKPGNGVMSSWAFKLAGWGGEVDNAKFGSKHH